MSESHDFLLNAKNLKTTNYFSLAIAHILFAILYPESIIVAGCGFAFFAALTLKSLRGDEPHKPRSDNKLAHIDK